MAPMHISHTARYTSTANPWILCLPRKVICRIVLFSDSSWHAREGWLPSTVLPTRTNRMDHRSTVIPTERSQHRPQARSETRFQCQQDADCTLHCDVGAVNRRWFEANRRGLGSCQEACDAEGHSAHCEHRSCVVRRADGKVHRACSRRR